MVQIPSPKLTASLPLKINNWKMKLPFEMVPFGGDMLISMPYGNNAAITGC